MVDHHGFTKIFLAGSIEMGSAEPWQERLVAERNKSIRGRKRISHVNDHNIHRYDHYHH